MWILKGKVLIVPNIRHTSYKYLKGIGFERGKRAHSLLSISFYIKDIYFTKKSKYVGPILD